MLGQGGDEPCLLLRLRVVVASHAQAFQAEQDGRLRLASSKPVGLRGQLIGERNAGLRLRPAVEPKRHQAYRHREGQQQRQSADQQSQPPVRPSRVVKLLGSQ